ncbi:MAG TPA: CPBP family intramembrane glutamic endopeptidase [Verrucomicrobiae bacterium]
MSFATVLTASRLPEKPWKTGAVVRLALCVLSSILMLGGLTAMVARYFETPQNSSPIVFVALAVAAFVFTVAAMVMFFRSWSDDERYLFNLLVLLVCIYGGMIFLWLAGRLIHGKIELENQVESMLIAVITFQGTALVFVHFFLREHSMKWAQGFGLNLRPGHALLLGACVGILTPYPAWILQDVSIRLFETLRLHPQAQQTVEILRHTIGLSGRITSGIATIMIAPIGEEIIFRGIFYPWAKRKFSQQIALWGTALLFGAVHANLASFIPLTLLAVVLVWLYEYTGTLLAPIAVHCVFNAANFVALYYQRN